MAEHQQGNVVEFSAATKTSSADATTGAEHADQAGESYSSPISQDTTAGGDGGGGGIVARLDRLEEEFGKIKELIFRLDERVKNLPTTVQVVFIVFGVSAAFITLLGIAAGVWKASLTGS